MPFYYQSHGKEPPNKFVAAARRIYNPLGFRRGYNFPLWVIFAGAALGFCASRAMYLDYDDTYKKEKWVTGDWEHQSHGRGRVGMLLHLACVIPIGFLLPWQFLPAIRHRFMLFHRLNGYILMTLLIIGNVGANMIADKALGGSLDARILVVILTVATTGSLLMAYINIKRLQIDQHRAWMLRAWSYAFVIITQRLIQLAAMEVVSRRGGFYVTMACHSVDAILSLVQPGLAPAFYPQCAGSPDTTVAVLANKYAAPTAEGIPPLHEMGATAQVTFAPTGMLALMIHYFAVEVYLHLTGAEANRLKRVSRERQLQRGWSRAGDASWLTRETWGDMDEFDYGDKKADGVSSLQTSDGPGSES